ncbi:MAG: hypothetical protein IJH68_03125 [Thermoguttaceae bacterium]|nr:hypothetical protein [Thermoguttaceae bacterium]
MPQMLSDRAARVLGTLVFSAVLSLAAFARGEEPVPITEFTPSQTDGTYYGIIFPQPEHPAEGELVMAAQWRIWIPDGVEKLRGVVVHQHGCGMGSCDSGRTGVYDIQWQELARKHDCALIAVSYRQNDFDCVCWCDPRRGSAKSFLAALEYFAKVSGHAELTSVPWAIWGHSGGAQWTSCMVQLYPERIVGAWLRSGHPDTVAPLFATLPLSDAVCTVPVMLNLGISEYTFQIIWDQAWPYFQTMRSRGVKMGLLIDPRTHHETGDSRYPAIRFLDLCLSARLPDPRSGDNTLRDMPGVVLPESEVTDQELGAASVPDDVAEHCFYSAAERRAFISDGIWLPSADYIDVWRRYSVDCSFDDTTPPPAPTDLALSVCAPNGAEEEATLTWRCRADLESGIKTFLIWRQKQGAEDWEQIAELPTGPVVNCRPVFQGCHYSDTPMDPIPTMTYAIAGYDPAARYAVSSVNTAELESEKCELAP